MSQVKVKELVKKKKGLYKYLRRLFMTVKCEGKEKKKKERLRGEKESIATLKLTYNCFQSFLSTFHLLFMFKLVSHTG